MTTPFLNFSIETLGGSSWGSLHETIYRARQLNSLFTSEQVETLNRDSRYFGYGQELRFDIMAQERTDAGDGMNFYYTLLVKRICDSGD